MILTRSVLITSAATAALLAAVPGHAQSTDSSPATAQYPGDEPTNRLAGSAPGSGDMIIVTAQKRTETLIDVPQSVTVVSGGTLERQQAVEFQDYLKLIPGLQLTQSNPGEARLTIRGINAGGVASTVATYVDETPFGSSSGQVNGAILAGEFDTFDIARIEVLRGPQGTLYGANSLGGVLKFVTATPQTDAVEARARGSLETTDGGKASYTGSAMLNLPVSDDLAVRGSGFYRKYGGYIDSIGTGGSDIQKNINGSKSYGGRVSALYKPSSDFSVRLTAILQNLNTAAGNEVDADPVTLRALYGGLTQSQFVPTFTDVSYRLYNGTVTANLGFADLTSSTSYGTLKESLEDDPTVQYGKLLGTYSEATGALVDIGLRQHTNVKRFTQEVRLSSHDNDTFEWLAGGYYTHEKGLILQRLDVFTAGTTTISPLLPQLADIFSRSRYEEYAGFVNGTLHLGPKFDISAGGRYSHNDQTSGQGGTGLLAPAVLTGKSSEHVFTWSVAPKYKFSETGAIYARVAKGFRPGGPNIVPPAAPANFPPNYRSDSLISYEVGVKADTADHMLSVDISAFHIDWKDIQLFAVFGNYGANANGGKAKSDGVEFTVTARPTPGFSVSANGAYTHARLTADAPAIVGGRKGDRLPYTPPISVSVNGDYEWKLAGTTTAYVGGSMRFLAKQSADFSAAYLATYGGQRNIPSYVVEDARLGIDFGRFSIEFYGKNLGNSQGKTNATGETSYPFGAIAAGIIRPRTFGVSLGAGI